MKLKLYFFLLLIFVFTPFYSQAQSKIKVLMLVPEGFYAPEYFTPRKYFEEAQFEITTAAKHMDFIRPDRRQYNEFPAVKPDITFSEVNILQYDALVFAGGNGAWEDFFPNEDVHRILTQGFTTNKTIALLCASTGLLGVSNNLNGKGKPLAAGKKVTGYHRVEGILTKMGKVRYYPGKPDQPFVMVDGNLITGRDPQSSELFAKTVVEHLKKLNKLPSL